MDVAVEYRPDHGMSGHPDAAPSDQTMSQHENGFTDQDDELASQPNSYDKPSASGRTDTKAVHYSDDQRPSPAGQVAPDATPTFERNSRQSASPGPYDSATKANEEDVTFKRFLNRLMSEGSGKDDKRDKGSDKPTIPWMSDAAVESAMLNTVPEVRKCDFEDFKNRYSMGEKLNSVDVLLEVQDMDAEMGDEQLRRLSGDDKKEYERHPRRPRQRKPHKKPEHTMRIERIRINSAYVLYYLSKASGESFSRVPHTFLKPFEYLTYFHEQMERDYESLAKRFGDQASQDHPPAGEPTSELTPEPKPEPTADPEADSGPPVAPIVRAGTFSIERKDSLSPATAAPFEAFQSMDAINDEKAFRDMRCYMEAMKPVMKWYKFFEDKDHVNAPKIHYDDLPALFRPGEILYVPSKSKGNDHKEIEEEPGNKGAEARLVRMYSMSVNSRDWIVDELGNDTGALRGEQDVLEMDMKVFSYHIDYDGTEYRTTGWESSFGRWEGEREITKLPVYPVRFSKEGARVRAESIEKGRMFRDLIAQKHKPLHFSGWTIIKDAFGEALETADGTPITHPDYIESEAIIDFAEAFQSNPNWKPSFLDHGSNWDGSIDWNTDKFAFMFWEDETRSAEAIKLQEVVFDHSWGIERIRLREFTKHDKLIMSPEERGDAEFELKDEDLPILPGRVLAYCLRERQFAHVRVEDIKPLRQELDPFRDLQINEKHKLVIRAVMDQHFKRKEMIREAERQNKQLTAQQDIVKGKGRGLVLLLHGAPGVGKTATAECIAQELKKPLLIITSGDMGLSPEEVDRSLSHIFRLADRWDCVLLMDEADVFLSAREQKDSSLQRNALVSIFLRTLEYYPGVLFLTTNRPGVLDEAVKSRVHMIFKYPALGYKETMEVFRLNLRMLKDMERDRADVLGVDMMEVQDDEIQDFARAHFAEKPRQRWNGRQIRNAFQIARSLAHFEWENNKRRGDGNAKLYLGAVHFENVAEATMAFDEYKQTTLGKSDDEHAASRMERARERVPDAAGRPDGGSLPSWRSNYSDGPYGRQPHTPQPSTQYGYGGHHYSAPPPQHQTPTPDPGYALGGSSMAPAPYGGYSQDRGAPVPPSYQHQQHQPPPPSSRPPMAPQYGDSPGMPHDLKQGPPRSPRSDQGYPGEPMRYNDEAQRYNTGNSTVQLTYRTADGGRGGEDRPQHY